MAAVVVFAPPSPFFKNVSCLRATKILAEQPPQGVFIRDDAGLVTKDTQVAWREQVITLD